jgi:adenosylcobinamide-phosphate synthase
MSWFAVTLPLACAALAVEAAFGFPAWIYRAIGHPVTWMGRLIASLDARLNRESDGRARRQAAGLVALLVLLGATGLVAGAVAQRLLAAGWLGFAVLALLAASLPAQRSLDRHVAAVAKALDREGLDGGRRAVSMIVGRNPATLDAAAVARAAIESLAENFSDGIVAPVFWTALGGLVGGALYKAANTADSMIGHRTPRHAAFGWAAARFDDVVNVPPARLAALWVVIASLLSGGDTRGAIRAVRRDAGRHRSPNAGWPEAAMAGALGLGIGGPRTYGETRVEDAFMGDGRTAATSADIRRALRLYRVACVVQGVALALLAAGVTMA